jgi:hypothetical protein
MTRDEIKDLLKQNVATIVFTKLDGTRRTLKCTLRPDLITRPEREGETTRKKTENLDSLAVWDLENNNFRSFRIESLITCDVD